MQGWRRQVKQAIHVVADVIEIHVPTVVFAILFCVFLLQIVSRYFFRPLTWPEELSLIAFIWTALLGGLYAKREGTHVAFTVIYDTASPKAQRWMRLIGNVLLEVSFVAAVLPALEYVSFMSFKRSNVLGIPMNIAYSPFVVFLVVMIVRLGRDIWVDVRGDRS